MDTFVENTNVAEEDKHIRVTPTDHEKQVEVAKTASAPLNEENATILEGQDEGLEEQIKIVRLEPADPLGRRTINLPTNEMKAGYGYAFAKRAAKR